MVFGIGLALAGVAGVALSPFLGREMFPNLWAMEPLSFIGVGLFMVGLAIASSPRLIRGPGKSRQSSQTNLDASQKWGEVTQNFFELFNHDLGRPMRRIVGRERELRAILQAQGTPIDPAVNELLSEIERQVPTFRLMMSNIQVLVQLEVPDAPIQLEPVEASEVVRKIIDRYGALAKKLEKEVTWWPEPAEFGIVYSHAPAIEHIVANLLDNAVRYATTHVEVRLTKNPTHFFVRVWDDGPGISSHYIRHIFDRGWTPEKARGEERSSSGLGLYIAKTLANRYGGDLTVESVAAPRPEHYTAFLLALPLGQPEAAALERGEISRAQP